MEWFNIELPLRDPHLLDSKEFELMAKIIGVQQEELFLCRTGQAARFSITNILSKTTL